jgi:hypothetical protein
MYSQSSKTTRNKNKGGFTLKSLILSFKLTLLVKTDPKGLQETITDVVSIKTLKKFVG